MDKTEKIDKSLEEEYKDYVENDPVYSKLVNRNAGHGIARHFAEWQKSQMLKDAVEGKVNQDGFLELSNGEVIDICPTLKRCALGLHIGDKVRIIVMKEEGHI